MDVIAMPFSQFIEERADAALRIEAAIIKALAHQISTNALLLLSVQEILRCNGTLREGDHARHRTEALEQARAALLLRVGLDHAKQVEEACATRPRFFA